MRTAAQVQRIQRLEKCFSKLDIGSRRIVHSCMMKTICFLQGLLNARYLWGGEDGCMPEALQSIQSIWENKNYLGQPHAELLSCLRQTHNSPAILTFCCLCQGIGTFTCKYQALRNNSSGCPIKDRTEEAAQGASPRGKGRICCLYLQDLNSPILDCV